MRRCRTIILVLLSMILAGVTACNPLADGEEVQQLVEVVRGDLILSVSGSGNIEASSEAKLTFGSGGQIDKIYIEKGDPVSRGELLAKLDTDALELAKTQAEVTLTEKQVALTTAEVALTQAQLDQQTAEYNLKNTQDTEDTLELALFNAQIDLRNAEHDLGETRDIYTWPEIEVAQDDVDDAKAFLDYLLSVSPSEPALTYAQARLTIAESRLDAMIQSYDTEEVAIAKLEVEAAEMAEAQAQKNLDELSEEIALKEIKVESAKGSVKKTRPSVALARQSVELARQSLDQARKNLDEATITAPFDGVVASLDVEEGDTVTTTTTIVYLINPSSMELIVEIDEIDIPEVTLNQEAIIEIDALPDVEFEGMVTAIYPLPITEGGVVLYSAKINLDVPENSAIKIGMSTEADIIIDKRSNVLLVPDRAIEEDNEGNPVVKVMVNEQIQERPVDIGISDGYQTEIVSRLNAGETVVIER
ncbi:MAG: efflux RND transporter periplasmic adaptor subunit [Dehalococcoidales bacterium]